MSLTQQQEQVLALISAGSTITDAAAEIGVHRNSIYNWLRSAPEFQNALADARRASATHWQEQAAQLASAALDTIHTLMTDPKTPAATRLRAAQFILNLAINPPLCKAEKVHNSALAFAVARRERLAFAVARREPIRRATPKIGRNDLCPPIPGVCC